MARLTSWRSDSKMITLLLSRFSLAALMLIFVPIASLHAQPRFGQSNRKVRGESLVFSVHDAAPSYDFEPVHQLIARELKQRNVPSISVAVAKDGKVLWVEAF